MSQKTTVNLQGILKDAYERLVKQDAPLKIINLCGRRFIGIRNGQPGVTDLADLRSILCGQGEVRDPLHRVVQIVGDSGTSFDPARILSAQQALARNVRVNDWIEYGLTAWKYDANWLVQDYISSVPEAAARTIANVVGQSVETLLSGEWMASEDVSTFAVLYNSNGTPTRFGEDTWVSDGIMTSMMGDKMLCFEGGVQAFHQCITALLSGIEVFAMTDLRSRDDDRRFSAARLLLILVNADQRVGPGELLLHYIDLLPPNNEDQRAVINEDVGRLELASWSMTNLIRKI